MLLSLDVDFGLSNVLYLLWCLKIKKSPDSRHSIMFFANEDYIRQWNF